MTWLQALGGFGAGLFLSMFTAPVGVSGAVCLLPFQLDVLRVPSPAVTPTNPAVQCRLSAGGASPVSLAGAAGWATGPPAPCRNGARCRDRRGRSGLRRSGDRGVPVDRRCRLAAPGALALLARP